jgi:hypothetical protein
MKFNVKVKEEDLQSAQRSEGSSSGPKFLQPGTHQVKITEVVDDGATVADSTWIKLKLTYEDKEGKTLRKQLLLVPTESLDYGADRKQGPKRNLLAFLNALGESVSAKTLPQTISKWFEKPQRLVNQRLEVKVGYSNPHAKYISKGCFQLVDSKEQPVLDESGEPIQASDRQSVELIAKQRGMRFDAFPSVIAFGEPLAKQAPSKKASAPSEDEEDLF